jgi:cation:H+ antiporter
MSPVLAVPLFLASLAVTLAAARLFARRLDHLGVRFGFPEAVIGLLTALAADGPEISSALFALIKGEHDVGVGVLVGSNGFNIAAMIGVSVLLTGCVRIPRDALWLEGLVGVAITVLASVLLLHWVSTDVVATLTAAVLIPYVLLVAAGSRFAAMLRRASKDRLADALTQLPQPDPPEPSSDPTHHLLGLIVFDLVVIVAGSAGMVQTALDLAGHWHIPTSVLGVLILGPLTSIPNALTAIRLGLAGRGAALVGETFNSNTLNLAAGVIAPALFVTFAAISTIDKLQLAWLLATTLLTIAFLARSDGMRRVHAAAIVVLYFAFVAGTLVG